MRPTRSTALGSSTAPRGSSLATGSWRRWPSAPLSAEVIVSLRYEVTRRPGTVARHPELVALWDVGPELRIRACHNGDGDWETLCEVPWAGSGDGRCVRLAEDTAGGRAIARYRAAWIPGSQGEPRFEADLESEW